MLTEIKDNINIKKDSKINIFTEIFPINKENIPRLYLYTIESNQQNIYKICGKIAYYFQETLDSHWINLWDKLISDKLIEPDKLNNLISKLKEKDENTFKDFEGVRLEKYWKPTPEIMSEFFSRGLTNDKNIKKEIDKVLSKYKYIIDNIIIEYEYRIKHIVIMGIPSLTISIKPVIYYKDILTNYLDKYGFDKINGLKVKDINTPFKGRIKAIIGNIGEHSNRERLIRLSKNKETQELIGKANDRTLIVNVSKSNNTNYEYITDSLKVVIDRKEIGDFTKNVKDIINHIYLSTGVRTTLIKEVSSVLKDFGIIEKHSINSKQYQDLFLNINDSIRYLDELIFGNNVISSINKSTSKKTQILDKIRRYRVFESSKNTNQKENKAIIINNSSLNIKRFFGYYKNILSEMDNEISFIEQYKIGTFNLNTIKNIYRKIKSNNKDIGLIILITKYSDFLTKLNVEDKYKNKTIIISEKDIIKFNMVNDHSVIQNKIIETLKKLGNIPFLLTHPFEMSKYVIKLSIKKNIFKESVNKIYINARIYYSDGKPKRIIEKEYKIKDNNLPDYVIKSIFPKSDFKNTSVLIHYDNQINYKDKKAFEIWANKINAELFFMEIITNDIPKIYNKIDNNITLPTEGTIIKISNSEAILATNDDYLINGKTYKTSKNIIIKVKYPLTLEQGIYSYLTFNNIY